jgi:hypothetical protein
MTQVFYCRPTSELKLQRKLNRTRPDKWPIEWSKEFDLAFADVTDLFYRQS